MTAGNDAGKVGEVLRVITSDDRVVVQGVNIRTRHLKPTQQNPQGGLLRKEMPIHISNVSPVVTVVLLEFDSRRSPMDQRCRVAVRGGKELHTLRGPRR